MVKHISDQADPAECSQVNSFPLQTLEQRVSLSRETFWLVSLVSGSSGNAYLMYCQGRYYLFDAGLSLKKFKESLQKLNLPEIQLTAIFITHEHSDHLQGLLSIQKYYQVPVYTSDGTASAILRRFPKMKPDVLHRIIDGETIYWDALAVSAHAISHDAAEPLSYTAKCGEAEMMILTDTGKCPDFLLDPLLEGPTLVVLEANYQEELLLTGPYSILLKQRVHGDLGHLSNEQAAEIIALLALRGSRKFILAHLSAQNNFPELANLTIRSYLKKHLPEIYSALSIRIAPRDEPMGPLSVAME